STVIVEKTVQDLMNLMHDLSAYSDQSIVQSDDKMVISASWAKDDDITRLLKSLPNWSNMAQPKQLRPKREEEEDFIRTAFGKESEVLIGNLGDKLIPQQEILQDVSDLRALANMHESLEWLSGRVKSAFSSLPLAQNVHSKAELPPVSEQILQTLTDLARSFQEMADSCLLVLHLEVRVHCFHYLIPLAKQGNYAIVANVESMDYDPLVVRLNKDISAVEEAMNASLQQHKFQYIFEGELSNPPPLASDLAHLLEPSGGRIRSNGLHDTGTLLALTDAGCRDLPFLNQQTGDGLNAADLAPFGTEGIFLKKKSTADKEKR
ncbi:putative Exocyst complex component 4 protein, partial [Naja naja]